MKSSMFIVDAHLDLSYNAIRGRDLDVPAHDRDGIATVSFPDLRAGGVGLVCATIFCQPDGPDEPGYRTPDEAKVQAWEQARWYLEAMKRGAIDFVTSANDLPRDAAIGNGAIDAILLLEGADPLQSPDEVKLWFDLGLRAVGLAWKRTRYAGGTGQPGPLTPEGIELVRELDRHGIIHDTSHLAEESFWQLLDLSAGPIMASHSNCRALVPTDRQLSDEMIRAIVARGGVIGMNFFDRFLLPPEEAGRRRATLADVVRHVRHVCDLAGSAGHVGLGTDMDGGLDRSRIPVEIETSGDLPRMADALADAGFPDEAVRGIMGGNWLSFFSRSLPP